MTRFHHYGCPRAVDRFLESRPAHISIWATFKEGIPAHFGLRDGDDEVWLLAQLGIKRIRLLGAEPQPVT